MHHAPPERTELTLIYLIYLTENGKKKQEESGPDQVWSCFGKFRFLRLFFRKGKMGTEQSVRKNEIGQKSGVFNGLERFRFEASYTK